MKNPNSTNSSKKLYCDIFGHNYQITKDVTYHVKEYKCKCCQRELTTNSDGRLTALTPKFKEINAILSRMYSTKLAKMHPQRFKISAA